MQQSAFDQLLSEAVCRRATIPSVSAGMTTAYRICDGEGDGLPGVFIDSYSGHWLVQTRDVPFPDSLRKSPPSGCRSLWWKPLTNAESERKAPQWVAGSSEEEIVAREEGVSYVISFASGYSQGIFLDQRKNRRWLQKECTSADHVLNLFAYTCAFSVAAGVAGASTTSVDLSSNYLDWGKRNFALNEIDPDGPEHRFFNWDTFDFLRMSDRKKERYQFIVCDPPTFSRNKSGKVFRVESDYSELVSRCLGVLESGGSLLCSTNFRGLSHRKFEEIVYSGALKAGRRVEEIVINEMPVDFTGDAYLKSVRARIR